MRLLLAALCLAACPALAAPPAPAHAPPPFVPVTYKNDTLAHILAHRRLHCGVITSEADFSNDTTHGNLAAFDNDLCGAMAAALLGTAVSAATDGYPDDAHGLRALHEGTIDLLLGVTPDAANALPYDVAFAPTVFFDSLGFMVNGRTGPTTPAQLAGKLLCYIVDTPTEQRLLAWRDRTGIAFAAQAFTERGEMSGAFEDGKCAAIADDVSELAEMRAGFARPSREFPILKDRVMIDPWAPAVRAGDTRLIAVITDVLAALIKAEELGIDAAHATAAPKGAPAWMTQPTPGIEATLHMPNFWAARAIAAHGNYGEIFDRDLGPHSDDLLERGPDALWTEGGMLAAPDIR